MERMLITTPLGFVARGNAGETTFTVSRGSLTGWFERGGVKQERISRENAPGDYLTPTFREARVVAWEGLIHTESMGEQLNEISQLTRVLGDGDIVRLSVQVGDVTWADAQLDSEPTIEILVPGRIASYRVRMYVPSGYRYGDLNTTASGQRASHRGSASAAPVFRVTASSAMSGYAVTAGGSTFTVGAALAAGSTHVIDMNDGLVRTSSGALVMGAARHPRRLWRIPPGAGVVHTLTPTSGAGSLEVRVLDTY